MPCSRTQGTAFGDSRTSDTLPVFEIVQCLVLGSNPHVLIVLNPPVYIIYFQNFFVNAFREN